MMEILTNKNIQSQGNWDRKLDFINNSTLKMNRDKRKKRKYKDKLLYRRLKRTNSFESRTLM